MCAWGKNGRWGDGWDMWDVYLWGKASIVWGYLSSAEVWICPCAVVVLDYDYCYRALILAAAAAVRAFTCTYLQSMGLLREDVDGSWPSTLSQQPLYLPRSFLCPMS